MKRRTLVGLISGLVCCSVVGVGFAAWVITGDASGEASGGNITAEAITDGSVTISEITFGSQANNDGSIGFYAVKDPSLHNIWLTNSNLKESEDLTAVCTFTIGNKENLGEISGEITATSKSSEFETAITNKVIKAPTVAFKNTSENNYTATITFAWGDIFTDSTIKNPYTFYNSHLATDQIADINDGNNSITYKAHAKKYMKMVENLNKTTFKLTVKASSTASKAE